MCCENRASHSFSFWDHLKSTTTTTQLMSPSLGLLVSTLTRGVRKMNCCPLCFFVVWIIISMAIDRFTLSMNTSNSSKHLSMIDYNQSLINQSWIIIVNHHRSSWTIFIHRGLSSINRELSSIIDHRGTSSFNDHRGSTSLIDYHHQNRATHVETIAFDNNQWWSQI